jgi:D-aminopeptidase
MGFKAGIGTSSRIIPVAGSRAATTLGALVQPNCGGTLTVRGVPIPAAEALAGLEASNGPRDEREGNSCMIVVATDAPLDARQLTRLATRAVFAMGRVGASYSQGSGDYGIWFSVGEGPSLAGRVLDPHFAAVQDAVEEALLDALFMAVTTVGYRGGVAHTLPLEFVRQRLSLG